jgi:hypothetical protein
VVGYLTAYPEFVLVVYVKSIYRLTVVYGPDFRGSIPAGTGKGVFLFSYVSSLSMGFTQPAIRWVLEFLSAGVKRAGREAD